MFNIQKYKEITEQYGVRCDIIIYPGQGHSFFNKQEFFLKTSDELDKFLSSLDYINDR